MKTNFAKLLVICTAVFSLASCSKSDDNPTVSDAELSEKMESHYNSVITSQFETALKTQLGMTINTGIHPPSVEGTYVSDRFYVQNSNFSDGLKGTVLGTTEFKFFNQNNAKLTVDMRHLLTYTSLSTTAKSETWDGNGCFIMGEGNKFTIFFPCDGKLTSVGGSASNYKNLIVVSGEVDKDESGAIKGIKNFQLASLMREVLNNPGLVIQVGQGRLFTDAYVEIKK